MADQLAWTPEQYLSLLALLAGIVAAGFTVSAWRARHHGRAAGIVERRTQDAARTKGFVAVAVEDPTTAELDPQLLYVADCGQMAALPADLFDAVCTCPWNNGYHVGNPHGHHVRCPSLRQVHTPTDGCQWSYSGLLQWTGHHDDDPAPTLREERIGQRMGDVHPHCLAARANAATDLICAECAEIFAQVGS